MNLTTAAKRLAIKSPVVVKKILEEAGIETQKSGRDLYIDDLAFNEAFKLVDGSDEMLPLADAAALLGITVASARNRLCGEGGIAEKIGGSWRVRRSDVAAMLPREEPQAEEAQEDEDFDLDGQELPEDEPQNQDGSFAATAPSQGGVIAGLFGSNMAFSKGMYEKISSDADAAMAILGSLSARMSQAIVAWHADCIEILSRQQEQ